MVKFELQINAQLENIEEIKTCHPNYSFFFKTKCAKCGEISEKWQDISESERVAINSRIPRKYNFHMKCINCNQDNAINIMENSNASYTINDVGKYKTIVILDCRGTEPLEFCPRHGWVAKTIENGQIFENIDLSEDDWAEYDEYNKIAVSITEFRSQFIRVKK